MTHIVIFFYEEQRDLIAVLSVTCFN